MNAYSYQKYAAKFICLKVFSKTQLLQNNNICFSFLNAAERLKVYSYNYIIVWLYYKMITNKGSCCQGEKSYSSVDDADEGRCCCYHCLCRYHHQWFWQETVLMTKNSSTAQNGLNGSKIEVVIVEVAAELMVVIRVFN